MDDTKRSWRTPLLAAAAAAVWLGVCLYLQRVVERYDGAVLTNPYYFWCFAPIELLACWLRQEDEPKPQKESRFGGVFAFLLLTGIAFYLVWSGERMRYQLYFWWIAIACIIWLAVSLYNRSPYRRPKKPPRARSPLFGASVVVLVLYLTVAASTALYLAALHPVTVEEITPIGEAEGGEFIGYITGNRRHDPLGLYWFADWSDSGTIRDLYYDVLTGRPVDSR